jgi:hypothetical protein
MRAALNHSTNQDAMFFYYFRNSRVVDLERTFRTLQYVRVFTKLMVA